MNTHHHLRWPLSYKACPWGHSHPLQFNPAKTGEKKEEQRMSGHSLTSRRGGERGGERGGIWEKERKWRVFASCACEYHGFARLILIVSLVLLKRLMRAMKLLGLAAQLGSPISGCTY
jgi:hypothetical protein